MNDKEKMSLIKLTDVHKEYELGKTKIQALKGINLDINKGRFVSIIGPSGCGKTTILNMIGCIDRPTSGEIFVEGNNVLEMQDDALTTYRGVSIGFIFQSFNLIPVLSIRENVSYPLLIRKKSYALSKQEITERTDYILEAVGLTNWAKHKPNELSGGQRQRVAIARALVIYPKIVIADEPTANLDSKTSFSIMELMAKLQKELHTTFVFATHDFRFIDFVDIIYEMQDGIIIGEKDKKDLGHTQ